VTTRTTVGDAAYHVGTVQDISARKKRERQLEELHVVTRHLMAASSRGEIATITARTAETLLGYEQSIVHLREDGDLVPAAVSEAARAELGDRPVYPADGDTPAARALRDGEPLTIEDSTAIDDEFDRGGAQSFTYVPLGDHGVLSVAAPREDALDRADIYIASILGSNTATALNRLADERDLERQNERFEAFFDVVSHDIPNHLNVAQTRLQLARADDELDQLEHVANAHQRIETVVDDMRTLVRQGDHVDETVSVDLSSVARSCWAGSRTGDGTASLEVTSDATVQASPSRLKQLLENLFWNAVEHGGPDVTVRVGLTDGTLFVADDGPGISPDDREEIVSPGYTTADGHSGFGLAIVREIARAHGWSMAVTDSEGGGARFEFDGVRTGTERPSPNDISF